MLRPGRSLERLHGMSEWQVAGAGSGLLSAESEGPQSCKKKDEDGKQGYGAEQEAVCGSRTGSMRFRVTAHRQ